MIRRSYPRSARSSQNSLRRSGTLETDLYLKCFPTQKRTGGGRHLIRGGAMKSEFPGLDGNLFRVSYDVATAERGVC